MGKKINFIITGGTIDSLYNGAKDTVEVNSESSIPDYIKSLKLYTDTSFSVVCMKDSRDLVEADRAAVAEIINSSEDQNFIVTHGTYTMPDTARYLDASLDNKNEKSIIFTGSMVPLVGFTPSDAGFCLGFAIASVLNMEPGQIKVAMNGELFEPSETIKKLNEGRFGSMFTK